MKRKTFIFSLILFITLMVSIPVFAAPVTGTAGGSASGLGAGGAVGGDAPLNTCAEFKEITQPIFSAIMFGAPSLLLLFGTIDFGKAVAAGDEKEMKKATSDFIKRLLICVVILLLPTLINLVMGWTTFGDLSACF